jgi:sec-independent protein translocase protein TatC
MPDITYYLDFAIKMFFAFGLAFEVPIATILMVWSGITTAEKLAAKRPYVIVGAFVIGMLLTPPDVISQTLLAIPMWVLFELGLLFSRFYARPDESKSADDEDKAGDAATRAAMAGAAAAAEAGMPAKSRVEPTFSESHHEEASADDADESVADDYGDNEDYEDANDSGHGEYEPLTEEEMEAELDLLEAEEDDTEAASPEGKDADEGEQDDTQQKPREDK